MDVTAGGQPPPQFQVTAGSVSGRVLKVTFTP
jgi:hypothetical protein